MDAKDQYLLCQLASTRRSLPRFQCLFMAAAALHFTLQVYQGSTSVGAATSKLAAPAIASLAILAEHLSAKLCGAEENAHFMDVGLQVISFASSLWALAAPGANEAGGILQQDVFMAGVMAVSLYHVLCGSVPEEIFYGMLCPCLWLCWTSYHAQLQGQLGASSALAGLSFVGVAVWLRICMDNWSREKFKLTQELEAAQQTVAQLSSAQQCILTGLFDGYCACNHQGKITEANAPLAQMLGRTERDLSGKYFPSFTSRHEVDRVQEFLKGAARNKMPTTTTIQTTLRGSRSWQKEIEVTVHCVWVPMTQGKPEGTFGAKNGVIILGVQEARLNGTSSMGTTMFNSEDTYNDSECKSETKSECKSDGESETSLESGLSKTSTKTPSTSGNEWPNDLKTAEGEDCVVVFDAGSPGFPVVSFSQLFEGMLEQLPERNLLSMLPNRIARPFTKWVREELHRAPAKGKYHSSMKITSLRMPRTRKEVAIGSAWLELDRGECHDGRVPVALRIRGLPGLTAGSATGLAAGLTKANVVTHEKVSSRMHSVAEQRLAVAVRSLTHTMESIPEICETSSSSHEGASSSRGTLPPR